MKHFLLSFFASLACTPSLLAQPCFLEAQYTLQWPLQGSFQRPKPMYGFGGVIGWRFARAWCAEARATYFSLVETDMTTFSTFTEVAPAIRFLSHHGEFTWHFSAGPSFLFNLEASQSGGESNTTWPFFNVYQYQVAYSGRAAVGGFTAFGFTFQDPNAARLSFLAEINARWAAWKPASSTTTEHVEERYATPPVLMDTTYVNEYSFSGDGPNFPMSTWGIRVGIQVRIGKLEKAVPAPAD